MAHPKKTKKTMRRPVRRIGEANDAKTRLRKGLNAEGALKRWSNLKAYAAMRELEDSRERMGDSESTKRYFEYSRRRDGLETAFVEKLKAADLFCSGILAGTGSRTIIEPSAWELLVVNYDLESVSGNRLVYNAVEFFEAGGLPSNIPDIPKWFERYREIPQWTEEFVVLEPNYMLVTMRGQKFRLGTKQAAVVRLLHEASRGANPWIVGKQLMHQVGSSVGRKVVELFRGKPNWRDLIEVEGSRYRLNLNNRRTF